MWYYSVETAAQCNNTSVAYMQNGDYRNAVAGFRDALRALRNEIVEEVHQEQCCQGPSKPLDPAVTTSPTFKMTSSLMSWDDSDFCESVETKKQPVHPGIFLEVPATSVEQTSLLTVFNKTVILPDIKNLLEDDVSLLPTVLLYNLGLAHHCSALVYGDCSEKLFKRAQDFYKMAMDIVQKDMYCEANHPLAEILSLAITNNMGHIFSCFFDAIETRRCLEWIAAVIESTDGAFVSDENYVFFHLNTILCRDHEISTTAPAA